MPRKSVPNRPNKRPRRQSEGGAGPPHLPPNWYQFQNRPIHPERGIDMDRFFGLFMINHIMALGWEQYVRTHTTYSAQLTREFYASIIPASFRATGTVRVRGTNVNFSAVRINQYYGVQALEGTRNGFITHEYNTPNQRNPALANALRTNPSGRWITTDRNSDLSQTQLTMEAAFWCLFITHSLRPSENRSNIPVETAFAMHSIINGLPIDVGHLILVELRRPAVEKKLQLVFPRLITQFCIEDGVVVAPEELVLEPGLISVRHYNILARMRDLPRLPPAGVRAPAEGEEEQNTEAPGDAGQHEEFPGLPPPAGGFERGEASGTAGTGPDVPPAPTAPPPPMAPPSSTMQALIRRLDRVDINVNNIMVDQARMDRRLAASEQSMRNMDQTLINIYEQLREIRRQMPRNP